MRFDSKRSYTSPIVLGLHLCSLDMGYLLLVGSNILLLLAVQQPVEILVFSQEKDIKT